MNLLIFFLLSHYFLKFFNTTNNIQVKCFSGWALDLCDRLTLHFMLCEQYTLGQKEQPSEYKRAVNNLQHIVCFYVTVYTSHMSVQTLYYTVFLSAFNAYPSACVPLPVAA